MGRINVTTFDASIGQVRVIGHFNADKTERFCEATDWDGSNHISVNTGSQWDHQTLLHTRQGRWVLRSWTSRTPRTEHYAYISNEQAHDWLLLNNEDAAAERYFGAIEEERGPGRPAVGGRVTTSIGETRLTIVDAWAQQHKISRGEAIRQLLDIALGQTTRAPGGSAGRNPPALTSLDDRPS